MLNGVADVWKPKTLRQKLHSYEITQLQHPSLRSRCFCDLTRPRTDKVLLNLCMRRSDTELPKCTKSRTERALPKRAYVLSDIELPRCTRSTTERHELNRAVPIKESELENRAKVRRDRELPN